MSKHVHPAIVKLGLQYASRQIVGSNLRCVAFLAALQKVISTSHRSIQLRCSIVDVKWLHRCRRFKWFVNSRYRRFEFEIEIEHQVISRRERRFVYSNICLAASWPDADRMPWRWERRFGIWRLIFNEVYKTQRSARRKNYWTEWFKILCETKSFYPVLLLLKRMPSRRSPMAMWFSSLDSKSSEMNRSIHLDPFSSSLIIRILETAIRKGIQFRVIIVDSRPQQHGSYLSIIE